MGQGQVSQIDSVPRIIYISGLAIILLCGFTYKTVAVRLQACTKTRIVLPKSLESFPKSIADWKGKDVYLDEGMARAAGNDDYCNRVYVNAMTQGSANVYIAYCGRPRTMMGHEPEVCYVSAGWIHSSTIKSKYFSRLGREIPCLIHRFRMPEPRQEELVILNFYIVNGKASNENVFSGMTWRTPNINGDIAHYIAQIQIISDVESTVLAAAADISDSIFFFLPDEQGSVGALKKQ